MAYRTHRNLTIILAIIYIPISIFGFLMGMFTEGAIGETNHLVIASCYVPAYIGMFTPFAAYGGLILSQILYNKGQIRAGCFARFLGLIVFASALLLGFLLEGLARFLA